MILSATVPPSDSDCFYNIKITKEFTYGQDYDKNTRFLVYGDKSDNISQNQFIPHNQSENIVEQMQCNKSEKAKLSVNIIKQLKIAELFGEPLREFCEIDSRAILSVL